VASGFVKGHWSGKSFKAISYSAIGPVDLIGGEGRLYSVQSVTKYIKMSHFQHQTLMKRQISTD